MENGIIRPYSETLLINSLILKNLISYFFPCRFNGIIRFENIDPLEQELLMQAQLPDADDLKHLIAQARALAEFENMSFNNRSWESAK